MTLYQRFAALITECENCWEIFVGPTQRSFWVEEGLYSARQSWCLDQAYHALTQSSALFINPQTFLVDMECKTRKGKKDEHFTACWENKDYIAKLVLNVFEFTRSFFTVVISRYQLELKMKKDLLREANDNNEMECMVALTTGNSDDVRQCLANNAPPADAIDESIRNTIATVESNKAIIAFQTDTADSTTEDKKQVALASQKLEQSAQETIAAAAAVLFTLREDSKTRYALSRKASCAEELKDGIFVVVEDDIALYEHASVQKPGAFGYQLQSVRLCSPGTPYKIESVCQTTREPMRLLLETESPVDQTKVFILACEGPDAYVDLPTTDERKRLQAEMATYGRNTLPQAKATRHSGIKLAATAKAHLTPRQPQPPLPQALGQAVADSSLELCAATETVQPVRIVPSKNVTMKIGRVLADLTCQKPEPKRVNGCGGGCHRDVQAKANSGEELCVLWFASEHRASPFVEWRAGSCIQMLDHVFQALLARDDRQ